MHVQGVHTGRPPPTTLLFTFFSFSSFNKFCLFPYFVPHATGLAYIGKGGGTGPLALPFGTYLSGVIRYPKLFFLFQNRDIEYFEIILKCVW